MTEQQTPPASSNDRRRTLVVDRTSQRRMILQVSLLPAAALMVAVIMMTLFCFRLEREAEAASVQLPSLTPLLLTIFGFAVVATAFIMSNAMRVSNRVAGPAFNICRVLRRLRDGEWDAQVTLRDGDELEELEEEVNQTILWVREQVGDLADEPEASPAAATETKEVGVD